jgi:uncharacterized protein YjbJ (UPF0337 family)
MGAPLVRPSYSSSTIATSLLAPLSGRLDLESQVAIVPRSAGTSLAMRRCYSVDRLLVRKQEASMDWNRVEGNWKQVKGKVREKWGKLTDDDLDVIQGRRDQLEGKIQERYGYAKDKVRQDIDDWYTAQKWQ